MTIVNEKIATNLKTEDFDYYLPEELIAQTPIEKRDESKLLVVHRDSGLLEHKRFYDIKDYLNPGDVLVINDSKVIPARIFGIKESTGVNMEVLLLREREKDVWEVILKPARRAKPGTVIVFGDGILRAEVVEELEDGKRLLRFSYNEASNIYEVLDKIGEMPLPPYIHEKLNKKDRYQTVYARENGSAAAPTAGLHFTEELLEEIKKKGVTVVPVMLHVGLGTFRPVKESDINQHIMHTEYISVSKESAAAINNCKGRVIAVGTTSCRVLESVSDADGTINPISGDTGIFIYPGYKFKATDCLITNFHLPKSTLLMLVSALAGKDLIFKAYDEAIKNKYRFFSFGDAMLIL